MQGGGQSIPLILYCKIKAMNSIFLVIAIAFWVTIVKVSAFEDFNVTLDIREDSESLWRIPRYSVSLWLEYHKDTPSLQNESGSSGRCGSILGESNLVRLSNVSGVWAACQDKYMPEGCESVVDDPCYPKMHFLGRFPLSLKTVKITFGMYGLAILRLKISPYSGGERNCYDYGYRPDPFSSCQFINIVEDDVGQDGWRQLVFTYDYADNISFSTFYIQLISRFSKDVIIIDKIEASEALICEDGETSCELTSPTTELMNPPSTYTTSRWTTPNGDTTLPSSTSSTESSWTEETTTTGPISHWNRTLDFWDQYKFPNGSKVDYWSGAQDGIKLYFEYYNDTGTFKGQHDQKDSCAHFMSQERLDYLSEVNGIWAACQDPYLPWDCATVTPLAPCSPFIDLKMGVVGNPGVRTIKVTFAIEELAILRLTVKGSCLDYSKRRDMFSLCEFIDLKDDETKDGWHLIHFSFYPDQAGMFDAFTVHLIARFQYDVILIDKIETTDYQLCVIDGEETLCPTRPTTPQPTYTTTTTVIGSSTTDIPITASTSFESPISTEQPESTVVMSTTDDETTFTTEESTITTQTFPSSQTSPVPTEQTSSSSQSASSTSSTTETETSSTMAMTTSPGSTTSSTTPEAGKSTSFSSDSTSSSTTESSGSSKPDFISIYAMLIFILPAAILQKVTPFLS